MDPTLVLASIVTLAALLAIASAAAGALWWRVRTAPMVRADELSRRAGGPAREVEAILARLEALAERTSGSKAGRRPAPTALFPTGPAACWRVDPPPGSRTLAGPTLIAVPDLAVPAEDAESEDAAASELAGRYGPIWELADAGVSPEAIARSTGHPIGQVELILGLRRQLAHTATGGRT